MLFGGLEAGGTKMVCAVGDENGNIIDQTRFDSDCPENCIPKMINYFKQFDIKALGISCFGPIDLNKKHDTYGYILKTPKEKWANTNIVGMFENALDLPVAFDTDVNGACLGEIYYGAGKGKNNVVYYTIGTGIGAGVYLDARLHHGNMHPETGHMFIKRHPKDTFKGNCIFHNDCLEGLASGPAIEKRYGIKCENIVNNKDFLEIESYYIGQAVANAVYAYSPEIVILGGGVMHYPGLIEEVRTKTKELLNGYIQTKEVSDIDRFVVLQSLQDNAGILGSIKLAELLYSDNK